MTCCLHTNVSREDHPHCTHSAEDHEAMGWTCDTWPLGGPCCQDKYYVTPFDQCPEVECPCPGPCLGKLQDIGSNIDGSLRFLECNKCGHACVARVRGRDDYK